jgi:hypothetical protein
MKDIDGQLLCAVRVSREKALAACEKKESQILDTRRKARVKAEEFESAVAAKWRKSLWCRLFCRNLDDKQMVAWAMANVSTMDCALVYALWDLRSDARLLHANQLEAVRQIRAAVQSSPDQEIWLSNEAIANLGGPLL